MKLKGSVYYMKKIKPISIPSTENHLNGINGSIPSRKEEENDGFSHYRKVKASLVENSIFNSFLCNSKISNKAKAVRVKKEVKEYV